MRLAFVVFLFFEVLTNADIVRLVKAGLSPATIEAKIAASETKFDTSTAGLVKLAEEDVPDSVIRAMIEHQSEATPPVPPVPAVAPAAPMVRRYDVAIHRSKYAKCEGAELRVDGHGVKGSRCKGLDFDVAWEEVTSVCYEYGVRGVIVFEAGARVHRISTTTPAEARKILTTVGAVRPELKQRECVTL